MEMHKCRVCQDKFLAEPLLKYENMPAAAQGLPDKSNLHLDKGICLELYQCAGCGLVQLPSEPVSYYKEVIRAAAFSPEMRGFRLEQFRQFLLNYKLTHKKVLEIGCGKGEYLALMQEAGATAAGIEYSVDSVEQARKLGLKVYREFIDRECLELQGSPYDAFFILNYLEHLPEPVATLKGMGRNLVEGGLGLVEVPNFDMILRKNLFSEFIPDHLFYFTKDSLAFLLQRAGFEIIELKEVWYDYILSAVVKKRSPLSIQHFYSHQEKLKGEIMAFCDRYRSVAVWGAGHQSLAIISLMNLSGKIKYVVDSAPFKQGKYTAASHVPIYSPKSLDSDPVDAILVMAASYSDEVARIISQTYGNKMAVSILRESGLESVIHSTQ